MDIVFNIMHQPRLPQVLRKTLFFVTLGPVAMETRENFKKPMPLFNYSFWVSTKI